MGLLVKVHDTTNEVGWQKKKIEPKPDQIYRSNYQFMVWDEKREECLNNNPDCEKLEDK